MHHQRWSNRQLSACDVGAYKLASASTQARLRHSHG